MAVFATLQWSSYLQHIATTIRRRQIVQKVPFWPPTPQLETPKDIATKSGETRPRMGQSSTIMQIFTPIGARYLPRAKNTYFSYRVLPWGLPSHAINFWKALVDPMLRPIWHVTLRLTVFEIFAVKIWDFGAPSGYPQKGRLYVGTHMYHHAKFHSDCYLEKQTLRYNYIKEFFIQLLSNECKFLATTVMAKTASNIDKKLSCPGDASCRWIFR